MERLIVLQGKSIPYLHKAKRNVKYVRLSVHRGGTLFVSAPPRVTVSFIERFMQKKSVWILRAIDRLKMLPPRPRSGGRREYLRLKDAALMLVTERLDHFNALYKFTWKDVRIRRAKTRWGSCSKKGNLNFNYKIVLLPPHLADYLVVHELCHLKEFNHKRAFWDLVAKAIPDHKTNRAELRKVSSLL